MVQASHGEVGSGGQEDIFELLRPRSCYIQGPVKTPF